MRQIAIIPNRFYNSDTFAAYTPEYAANPQSIGSTTPVIADAASSSVSNGLPADVKAEAARKAEERLKYMTFYSTTPKCLRGFLLEYFGEAAPKKCGNCSCCLAAV